MDSLPQDGNWDLPAEDFEATPATEASAASSGIYTLWSDVSEFQCPVNNSYPYNFFALRSHDGSHNDSNFMANVTWANDSVKSGKLWGYIVYYFYRPGFNGATSFINRIGPHPNSKMVAMIDVESAGGQVRGNQSAQINGEFNELAKYLGDARRVIGYGNTSDLNALWPTKPHGCRLIVAAYGSNPGYPGKFAHQFEDNANTRPFGPSDLNSADGMTPHDLQTMFGMTSAPAPPPPGPSPTPGTQSGPSKVGNAYRWEADGTISLQAFAARRNSMVLSLLRTSTTASLNAKNYANLNKYVMSGVTKPMPRGLVFYTANA
jgi:hypothetical protein